MLVMLLITLHVTRFVKHAAASHRTELPLARCGEHHCHTEMESLSLDFNSVLTLVCDLTCEEWDVISLNSTLLIILHHEHRLGPKSVSEKKSNFQLLVLSPKTAWF